MHVDMKSVSFRHRIRELGFAGPDIDKRTLTLRELMGNTMQKTICRYLALRYKAQILCLKN